MGKILAAEPRELSATIFSKKEISNRRSEVSSVVRTYEQI
jgi:hypothetical protein